MSRLVQALITACSVALVVFLALRLVPGDPIELMLGENAAAADRELLRAKLGLAASLPEQLKQFVLALFKGDLGYSIADGKPVKEMIAARLPFTLALALSTLTLSALLGVPAGVLIAARRQSRAGRTGYFLSLLLATIPVFWLAPLLIIAFGLRWPWLPMSGYAGGSSMVLPVVSVSLGLAAYLAQTTRAAMSECLSSDYIRTAVAKGMSPARVLLTHALPNAAVPIATVVFLQLGQLLTGSVIIETIFDWPGIGKLAIDAILARDYPVVQGITLFVAFVYVAINALTDLFNSWLNPRKRAG